MTDTQELDRMREEALDAVSLPEIRWSFRQMSKTQKQHLLRLVGLKLDPKFLKSGVEPLIQARLRQLRGVQRREFSRILAGPCLAEFDRELGLAFEDPSEDDLRACIPRIDTRCGSQLVKLTLVNAVASGARASDHILVILAESDSLSGAEADRGMQHAPVEGALVEDAVTTKATYPSPPASTAPNSSQPTLLPVVRMLERTAQAKWDSDATYYSSLLLLGELVTKLVAISLTASIDAQADDSQIAYAKHYDLVRADGIGAWAQAIQDLTTAPVYRLLVPEARSFHTSLTQRFGRENDSWQREAINALNEACRCFPSLAADNSNGKISLSQWFQLFAALRNKTRGHGADQVAWQAEAAPHLSASLDLLIKNIECFHWPWWNLYRTIAGAVKIQPLCAQDAAFEHEPFDHPDGLYAQIGSGVRRVELLTTATNATDFFLPNGDAQDAKSRYEELSYISGLKRWANLTPFVRPPRELPISETHGSAELRAVGNVLTNLPEARTDYVRRAALEDDLQAVLTDARHPVVAINGPGGIGKTSLALQVLHELAQQEAFSAVLWFSARDIDLDPIRGPLAVKPAAQSLAQFAKQYWSYVEPSRLKDPTELLVADFLDSLTENEVGPVLYVFDNFETVHNPPQLFRDISQFARLPNKILITTRHREFKGDWPLDVEGMSREEFDSLVEISGLRLKIDGVLKRNANWVNSLYRESGGHPYVVKVALGEVARSKKVPQKFDRIMASRDEILDALFERSFNRLNPSAQRVFFTLCKWRARVPAIALEAVMTRPGNARMDVAAALRHLEESSLIERAYSEVDAESFLYVPAAAYRFGIAQLRFSEIAQSVDEDARYLYMFGAVSDNVAKTGFGAHVHRYYDNAAKLAGPDLEEAIAIGEYVARRYPESWLYLAAMQKSLGGAGKIAAKRSYQSYLARRPDDADAWLDLSSLCADLNDGVGELRAASQASVNADRRYNRLSVSLLSVRERVESGRLQIDSRQKREFVTSLCEGWHVRENQTTVGDCFNLGKLAERADDPGEVLFWVERALRREPNNQRLLDLRRRASAILSGRPS